MLCYIKRCIHCGNKYSYYKSGYIPEYNDDTYCPICKKVIIESLNKEVKIQIVKKWKSLLDITEDIWNRMKKLDEGIRNLKSKENKFYINIHRIVVPFLIDSKTMKSVYEEEGIDFGFYPLNIFYKIEKDIEKYKKYPYRCLCKLYNTQTKKLTYETEYEWSLTENRFLDLWDNYNKELF